MFLLKTTFYTILCSLFIAPRSVFFYTVDILPCSKQLLLTSSENQLYIITGVAVASCRNISCCNLSSLSLLSQLFSFAIVIIDILTNWNSWRIDMLMLLPADVLTVDMVALQTCCCWRVNITAVLTTDMSTLLTHWRCWHLMGWRCWHVGIVGLLTADVLTLFTCWSLTQLLKVDVLTAKTKLIRNEIN